VTLGHDAIPERISYARESSKLPVVLSADEVVRFLEATQSLKSRTALTTVYAAGLRVSELVLLKISDIDSQRMVIRVEQGKGGKDRYVMLSPQLLRILRSYWRLARPQRWLFSLRDQDRPLDPTVLHAACRSCPLGGRPEQKGERYTHCGTASQKEAPPPGGACPIPPAGGGCATDLNLPMPNRSQLSVPGRWCYRGVTLGVSRQRKTTSHASKR
jgi:hypothetical protein